jgi:hypothetical protein
MPFYPKQDPSLDLNHQQKGGGQLQPMDENGEGYAPLIMSPNSLPCINTNGCEYLGGLSHHPMVEMTNQEWKSKNA